MTNTIRVGCAGWAIPASHAELFPNAGSHLERYSARLSAVEINSSFHRRHMPRTYERWTAAVPDEFRFSIKLPKQITHVGRLEAAPILQDFLRSARALGAKLGPLLIQLPPSLEYDAGIAAAFFQSLRSSFGGMVVCEPRHSAWFGPEANRLLSEFQVARVAADPAPVPEGAEPGAWDRVAYFRLHGSPRRFYSAYTSNYLDDLSLKLAQISKSAEVWCIFDNTASGAATANAIALLPKLPMRGGARPAGGNHAGP
jgi:uncharacterized protein YecE (DUF72 family)